MYCIVYIIQQGGGVVKGSFRGSLGVRIPLVCLTQKDYTIIQRQATMDAAMNKLRSFVDKIGEEPATASTALGEGEVAVTIEEVE